MTGQNVTVSDRLGVFPYYHLSSSCSEGTGVEKGLPPL